MRSSSSTRRKVLSYKVCALHPRPACGTRIQKTPLCSAHTTCMWQTPVVHSPPVPPLPCYGARARNSRHHKHIDEEQTLKEVLRQADLFQHHERRLEEYKRANARQNNQGDVAHSVMGRLILNVNVSCWQVEIFEKEQAAKRATDGCRS